MPPYNFAVAIRHSEIQEVPHGRLITMVVFTTLFPLTIFAKHSILDV